MTVPIINDQIKTALRQADFSWLQQHFAELTPDNLIALTQSTDFQQASEKTQQYFKALLIEQIDMSMKKIANISKSPRQMLKLFDTLLAQTHVLEKLDPAKGKQDRYYAHCSLGHSYSIQLQHQAAFNAYLDAANINPNGTTAFAGMISASSILAMTQDPSHVRPQISLIKQHFDHSKALQQNDQICNMMDGYLSQVAAKFRPKKKLR